MTHSKLVAIINIYKTIFQLIEGSFRILGVIDT